MQFSVTVAVSQKRCKIGPKLLLMTNRKSHFWEARTAKGMKIDPYCQQLKCSPMTLISGNVRRMRIFTGVSLGGGVK